MPTAHARVATDRASRYLAQLCRHLDELQDHAGSGHRAGPESAHGGRQRPLIRHVEWSDTDGTVDFGAARLTLHASLDILELTLDAPDDQTLSRLRDTVANRVRTIGRRDRLTVTWQQHTAATTDAGQPPSPGHGPDDPGGTGRYRRRSALVLVAVAAMAVGLHAAVAAAVLTRPSWLSWAADTVLVLVGLKLAAIALGGAVLRHRLRPRIPLRRRQP